MTTEYVPNAGLPGATATPPPKNVLTVQATIVRKKTDKSTLIQHTAAKQYIITTLSNINTYKDASTKILTCLLHADLTNMGEPGTFQEVLQETLKCNNLPIIKIPKCSPSTKIMDMAYKESTEHSLHPKHHPI